MNILPTRLEAHVKDMEEKKDTRYYPKNPTLYLPKNMGLGYKNSDCVPYYQIYTKIYYESTYKHGKIANE